MGEGRRRMIKRDSTGRRTGRVDKREENEIRKLYVRKNLTVADIGTRLGRDPRTVKTHLEPLVPEQDLIQEQAVTNHGHSGRHVRGDLKSWITEHVGETAEAIEAYSQELRKQIDLSRVLRMVGGVVSVPRNAYGLAEWAIIEAITAQDNQLATCQTAFDAALDEGDFDRTYRQVPGITERLQLWLQLEFGHPL